MFEILALSPICFDSQECEELELPEAVKRHTLQQIRKKEDARRPLMAHH